MKYLLSRAFAVTTPQVLFTIAGNVEILQIFQHSSNCFLIGLNNGDVTPATVQPSPATRNLATVAGDRRQSPDGRPTVAIAGNAVKVARVNRLLVL